MKLIEIVKPVEPSVVLELTKQEIRLIRKALDWVPYNKADEVDATNSDVHRLWSSINEIEKKL